MKAKPVIRGLISYIPGLLKFLKKAKGKNICGGTDSARYCYSIWMRHLVKLHENFGNISLKSTAEIGPGDSLGMGIMSLLTGADKYYAFEVKKQINTEKNLQIFKELSELFLNKERIPDDIEFPLIEPKLENYGFPEKIFENNFDFLADRGRIDKIRKAIISEVSDEIEIRYIIPWYKNYSILKEKIDIVFTQAVMEHLNNLDESYGIMHAVLRNGGVISHEIDYSSHETHESWNGHLNFGNFIWKIIMHGRPYDINRYPHSYHIESIQKSGFRDIKEIRTLTDSKFSQIKNLVIRKRFNEEDLQIQNAFIQARKQ